MKISSVLDSYVRRSLIGKYITCLRRYSPGLYALMKRLWEKTVPIRSAHNLARYQRPGPPEKDRPISNSINVARPRVV